LAIVIAKGVNYDKKIEVNLVNDMFNAPKSKIDKRKNNNKVPEKKFI